MVNTRGVLVTLPAQLPDDNANQQGLKREYQIAAATSHCPFRFDLNMKFEHHHSRLSPQPAAVAER
jgi:hypothetical protein